LPTFAENVRTMHKEWTGSKRRVMYDRGRVHALCRDVLGIWYGSLWTITHTLPSPHPQDRAGSVQKSAMQVWLETDDGGQWIRDRKNLFGSAPKYVVAAKHTPASAG
jgi:hypothetical protein